MAVWKGEARVLIGWVRLVGSLFHLVLKLHWIRRQYTVALILLQSEYDRKGQPRQGWPARVDWTL